MSRRQQAILSLSVGYVISLFGVFMGATRLSVLTGAIILVPGFEMIRPAQVLGLPVPPPGSTSSSVLVVALNVLFYAGLTYVILSHRSNVRAARQ
jgi:hypothetical protein